MAEAVQINMSLVESSTGDYVVNARVIAVSNQGLGNVTLASSDDEGNVTDSIMPIGP